MYIAMTKPLFAWDCLQDSPSLATIKEFLASIPDAKLLEVLRQHRGRGRNDCPVHVAWGVVLLRIALRHVSFEATLAELERNEALRRLIGIEEEEDVPKSLEHLAVPRRAGPRAAPLGVAADLRRDGRSGWGWPCRTWARTRRATPRPCTPAARGRARPRRRKSPQGLPQPSGGKKEYTRRRGQGDQDRRVVRLQAAPAGGRQARSGVGLPGDDGQCGRLQVAAGLGRAGPSQPARRPHRDVGLRQGGRRQRVASACCTRPGSAR